MTQLFYHLIHQVKTKRWFGILDRLEATPTLIAQTLARQTQCTKRTIQSDIKEIKAYFDSAIILTGDDEGYQFSFQDPACYREKKQTLLDHEPLFLLMHQLVNGTRRTNQEWARILAVSTASFWANQTSPCPLAKR